MAHPQRSGSRDSTRHDECKASGTPAHGAPMINDMWMSDLSSDLGCLGLCCLSESVSDRPDDLAVFSLTTDVDEAARTAARTRHGALGL